MFSQRSMRRGPDGGGDDDVRELVRAMSQRDVPVVSVQARSRSVAVGRIDEDVPYEFGADAGSVGLPPLAVRRSRSAAGVRSGLAPRVGGVGGGFGATAVTRKPSVGGGGFGASAVTRKPAVGVVHGR